MPTIKILTMFFQVQYCWGGQTTAINTIHCNKSVNVIWFCIKMLHHKAILIKFVIYHTDKRFLVKVWIMMPCSGVVGYQWLWLPWRWQHGHPKHWYPITSVFSITMQKAITWIFIAMKI